MKARIVVGEGSCGLAAGAAEVFSALKANLTDAVDASLSITGCVGACFLEPIVDVYDAEGVLHRCVHVAPDNAETIVKAVATADYSLSFSSSRMTRASSPSRPASRCVTAASSIPRASTRIWKPTATTRWKRF